MIVEIQRSTSLLRLMPTELPEHLHLNCVGPECQILKKRGIKDQLHRSSSGANFAFTASMVIGFPYPV